MVGAVATRQLLASQPREWHARLGPTAYSAAGCRARQASRTPTRLWAFDFVFCPLPARKGWQPPWTFDVDGLRLPRPLCGQTPPSARLRAHLPRGWCVLSLPHDLRGSLCNAILSALLSCGPPWLLASGHGAGFPFPSTRSGSVRANLRKAPPPPPGATATLRMRDEGGA